ncbi:MAG TPA: response regulator [Clostridium sp.]
MYRVLLVNDCKFENFVMRDMLISLGCEVIISNEFNALSDARELNCNVIIANFIMKVKTGDKILQQIKHMYPQIKCILSSSNDIRLENFNKNVIEAFIRTPVTREKLKNAIKETGQLLNEHKEYFKPSYCVYCGEKLNNSDGGAKFCKHCGKNIDFS